MIVEAANMITQALNRHIWTRQEADRDSEIAHAADAIEHHQDAAQAL